MWGRLKGQVLRSKEDQDASDDDTIISRALIRYYAPEVPTWLVAPGTNAAAIAAQYESTTALSAPGEDMYMRRDSNTVEKPRMFERSDSFAATSSGGTGSQTRSKASASSSGLASRLKNSKW